MGSPLISIVIVNWNTKGLLLECIGSITNDCKRLKTEIIVSDNASTDGSADAVRTAFPDVKLLLNSDNLGFAGGNNLGIKECSGEYVCLVNTDVEILSGCFSGLLNFIENNPDVGIVGPQALYADKKVQITARKEVRWFNSFLHLFWVDTFFPSLTRYSQKKIEEVDIVSGCFWMIRRKALEDTGLLDHSFFFYGEDRDYCKRMWIAGWKVVYNPECKIIHYEGGSSKARPLGYYLQLERAYIEFWRKYHSRLSNLIYYLFRIVYHATRAIVNIGAYICGSMGNNRQKEKAIRHLSCVRMLLAGEKPVMVLSTAGSNTVKSSSALTGHKRERLAGKLTSAKY